MNQTPPVTSSVPHGESFGEIWTSGAFLVMAGVSCVSLVFITLSYCIISTVHNKLNEWDRRSATARMQLLEDSPVLIQGDLTFPEDLNVQNLRHLAPSQ